MCLQPHRHLYPAVDRSPRRCGALFWLAIVAGLLPMAAVAGMRPAAASATVATHLSGAFSITPARRSVVARPPVGLQGTRVGNTTDGTLRVHVVPVWLTQTLSGAFSFDSSRGGLESARRVLRAAPGSFRLAPSASREVSLAWRGLPRGSRQAVVGMLYEAVPSSGPDSVHLVERLLGVNVLRLPGHFLVRGAPASVGVLQAKARVLQFRLGVRNTGQAVAGPRRLTLTVDRQHGGRVLRQTVAGDIVLPGATRDFVLNVSRRLPAGSYAAHESIVFGPGHSVGRNIFFNLTGPNELPSPRLQVGPLVAHGTVGGQALLETPISNVGTAPSPPTSLELSLFRLIDGTPSARPIASRRVTLARLGSGQHGRIRASLGRLSRGTYSLLASYRDSTGTPQTYVADFAAQPHLGVLARLRRFLSGHLLIAPLAVLFLAMVLVVALLARQQRLARALAAAKR
jgi:hypothetical protein